MEDEDKGEIAIKVITRHEILLSTQVINEICINLLTKASYTENEIAIVVKNLYSKYRVITLNMNTILTASSIRKRYKFSYWDSLIVASALESGCSILYTEDMQHGQTIENTLTIQNPFITR
jgi:predicted nucleic acid-binding protein